MRFALSVIILISISLTIVSADGTAVIYNAHDGWMGEHAAKEFAKYSELLTGQHAVIMKDNGAQGKNELASRLGSYESIVLIGNSSMASIPIDISAKLGTDGFVIKTINPVLPGGTNALLIAGNTGKATLYGVYHYLETCCGVGFFWDGDRVPRIAAVPVSGLDIVEKPRFALRYTNLGGTYRGIDKFDLNNWTFERWKQALDWMAKRKLNITMYYMGYMQRFSGSAAEDAFPEMGPEPEKALYTGGFPAGWDWPASYRTQLTKRVLDYGRKLGIRFIYSFDLSVVSLRFKNVHPELKYIEQDTGYGAVSLYPGEEKNLEIMRRYGRKVIEEFGTDHIYACTPLAEAAPGKNLDEQRTLKIKAAQDHLKLITSIDSKAVWLTDSWCFIGFPDLWTPEFLKTYLDSVPDDRFYVYDTGSELFFDTPYKKFDYFCGKPFAVGILHAYGSDDNLFGSFERLVSVVKDVASDPRARNCNGLFGVPEHFGDNVAYWHLFTKLAWNPDAISIRAFLDNYTLARYGAEAQPAMKKAWRCLLESVHSYDLDNFSGGAKQYYRPNNPFYKFRGLGFGCPEAYPLCKEYERFVDKRLDQTVKMAPELGEALELALSVAESCKGNKLYVNDVVDIARTYLGYVSDYHLCLAYRAFKQGNAAEFDKQTVMALDAIKAVQNILATRPEFSEARLIRDILSVPGTNKYAPEMARTGCIAADYANRDVTELIRDYYIPLVEHSFSVMRQKMAEGSREVAFAEISPYQAPGAKEIREKWIKNATLPGYTGGDTIEATRSALASVAGACAIDPSVAGAIARNGETSGAWVPTWDKVKDE
ncbi:MAG: alpha-N-acetylglucosaminidase C-terminal domain-containing protein [Armatimonadetes bacterium]|nr:alpha-N-acetylglucosaminidase C-terminal domain-containing protein [Armatimonadota bacterium]